MTIVKVLAIASLALAAGALAEQVRADEVFLCEDGRQVRVPFGQIERMKQTEPCVAAYYGLTAKSAPEATTTATTAEDKRRAAKGLRGPDTKTAAPADRNGPVNLSNIVILNAGHATRTQ